MKKFYHVVSKYFYEHAIFSSFPSLFLHCHFFGFLLVYVWTLGFSSDLFSKITSFIHISIVSLFPFITFSFVKDYCISNFHKTMSKDNTKNNYSSTNYAKKLIKIQSKEKNKNAFTSKWV
jgi:hypothetical protein